eukprot:4419202-Amphidinium_carterae.1
MSYVDSETYSAQKPGSHDIVRRYIQSQLSTIAKYSMDKLEEDFLEPTEMDDDNIYTDTM